MGSGAPFLTDPAGAGVAPRLDQLRPQSVRLCLSVQQTQPPCWLTGTMRVWLGWGTSQERNEWEVLAPHSWEPGPLFPQGLAFYRLFHTSPTK